MTFSYAKVNKGGTYKVNLGAQPTTLNPLSSTDGYASTVQKYVLDTFLKRNYETYEWEPGVAKEWKVSDDGLHFDFTIRENVVWHDGKPLTIEDLKFSFDAIIEPTNKYKTAHMKSYYENFEKAEILNKTTIRFIAKKKYFGNLEVLADTWAIPKHIYSDTSKKNSRKMNKQIIGSGPYVFSKWRRGKSIVLKGNKKWWGSKLYQNQYNFNQIVMRFVKESAVALQRLERGDFDLLGLSAEQYLKKTNSKKWGKELNKVETKNKAPKGYGFVGWNLKIKKFQSKKVRWALTHLMNRKLMNEKFRYNKSLLATGPWYRQSEYADQDVKPMAFDPALALKLLREEGWKDTDGDQILDKDGEKFEFTLLNPSKDFMKYFTIYKEDLKKSGIKMNIKLLEWNTFIKLLEEKKFDALALRWGNGSVDMDPKQIWHSESSKPGGSNFNSYSNKKVDALIDQSRTILDKKERIKKFKVIYKLIANDAPYVFLFNTDSIFYGHSTKLQLDKPTLNYDLGTNKWYYKKL